MQETQINKTGWIFAEQYLWHDTQRFNLLATPSLTVQPGIHAENEETKRRFRNLVAVSSLEDELMHIKPRMATDEELLRFHTQEYLTFLEDLCASGGGLAAEVSPVGPASYEIAKLAAGGVFEAVDAVINKTVKNAYVLCRPPGHHADADAANGFCLLANGVLGVEHARAVHGLKRFAIIDFDVHHGNGAETAFYEDPDVLTISLHQDNLFPTGRGKVSEVGRGDGLGCNLNIPLPPGSGSGAYRAAFDQLVKAAVEDFEPDMIFVASGFDASAMDPLGHMMLSSDDYRYITDGIVALAETHCDGRLVMTHEGGYSEAYVPYCGLAVLEAMSGVDTGIEDPFISHIVEYGGQTLQPHQQAAIDEVAAHSAKIGKN